MYIMTEIKEPSISIIVPVFNSQKYLRSLFDSINNLNWKDYEIIFVDDGSTDNSFLLLNNYLAENKNMRLFHITNHGQAFARNFGLSKARGKYIFFLDSDDMLHPNIFNILFYDIEKYNCDIAICSNYFVNRNRTKTKKAKCTKLNHKCGVYQDPKQIIEMFFSKNNSWVTPWGKLYKHELVKKIENYPNIFPDDYETCEDAMFNFKYFNLCKRVLYSNRKLYFYRMLRNGNSRKVSKLALKKLDSYIGLLFNYNAYQDKKIKKKAIAASAWFSFSFLWKLCHSDFNIPETAQRIYKIYKEGIRKLITSTKFPTFVKFGIPLTFLVVAPLLRFRGKLKIKK